MAQNEKNIEDKTHIRTKTRNVKNLLFNAFYVGFSSVFGINYNFEIKHRQREGLYSDWAKVGNYLKSAIGKVEHGN